MGAFESTPVEKTKYSHPGETRYLTSWIDARLLLVASIEEELRALTYLELEENAEKLLRDIKGAPESYDLQQNKKLLNAILTEMETRLAERREKLKTSIDQLIKKIINQMPSGFKARSWWEQGVGSLGGMRRSAEAARVLRDIVRLKELENQLAQLPKGRQKIGAYLLLQSIDSMPFVGYTKNAMNTIQRDGDLSAFQEEADLLSLGHFHQQQLIKYYDAKKQYKQLQKDPGTSDVKLMSTKRDIARLQEAVFGSGGDERDTALKKCLFHYVNQVIAWRYESRTPAAVAYAQHAISESMLACVIEADKLDNLSQE